MPLTFGELDPGTAMISKRSGGTFHFVGYVHATAVTGNTYHEYWMLVPGTVLNDLQNNKQVKVHTAEDVAANDNDLKFKQWVCDQGTGVTTWDFRKHSVTMNDNP